MIASASRKREAKAAESYYRARYYNSGSARFISEDPLGAAGGINLFAYALNSPVVLVDPSGLKACCDAKLPQSPIREVALTCFAEATPGCEEGPIEKRAITDSVYNRQTDPRKYGAANNSILAILSAGAGTPNPQYGGYSPGAGRYGRGETPSQLEPADCQELKDCIEAAKASAGGTKYPFTFFNQTYGSARSKICNHYFFQEWPRRQKKRR